MQFNDYQTEAKKTAIFPQDNQISYLALALCGEAGEAADKVKKIIRDKNRVLDDKDRESLALELGDCLWYISNFAECLGYSFDEIAQMNIEKIMRRQKNGTIHGKGDYR